MVPRRASRLGQFIVLRKVLTTLVLSLTWAAWSWHLEPIVVGFGILSVILTVVVASRLKILDSEGEPFEINFRLIAYLPWLAKEVLLANIAVARVILDPKLPIHPHLIRLRAKQRTSLGQVIFANTITLTPGTISLDLRDNVLLVHALDDGMAQEDNTGTTSQMICWLEARVHEDDAS